MQVSDLAQDLHAKGLTSGCAYASRLMKGDEAKRAVQDFLAQESINEAYKRIPAECAASVTVQA